MGKKITGLDGLAALTGMGSTDAKPDTESSNVGSVYSTATGKTCPNCGSATAECSCKNDETIIGDGKVRISLDKKGRKGKGMTLITGLPLPASDLKKLAKELKQKSGVGGAVKDGIIEIQGDQRQLMLEEMNKRGYQAKLSGG